MLHHEFQLVFLHVFVVKIEDFASKLNGFAFRKLDTKDFQVFCKAVIGSFVRISTIEYPLTIIDHVFTVSLL